MIDKDWRSLPKAVRETFEQIKNQEVDGDAEIQAMLGSLSVAKAERDRSSAFSVPARR